MKKHNLAFIDIETTGLSLIKNEIIEIGCVIASPSLEKIEEFEIKIKPERIEEADPVAIKINRYNEEDWKDALPLKEALLIFLEKVKDCIMVGHNVSFDVSFLEYSFNKLGMKNSLHYHRLDTVSIAWAKLHKEPGLEHFSLRELGERFEVKNEKAHSALPDARATFLLYKKLMEL